MAAPQAIALNKFGLGARPDDRVGDDPHGWVLDQLSRFEVRPSSLASQLSRAQLIAMLDDYRQAKDANRQAGADAMMAGGPQTAAKRLTQNYADAVNARLASAYLSDTPFVDRLVYFWSNHFAVSAEQTEVRLLAGNYEFDAIRPHILSNFSDLLVAAVTHPAMLVYLDQARSIGPNSSIGLRRARHAKPGQKAGLNENLAREIMELHTRGVRTGYSQSDVTELARALTGWNVPGIYQAEKPALAQAQPGESAFLDAQHEPGSRVIMGKSYAEDGAGQAAAILADLAASPATARHIATKLARHFIADDPPPAAVDRIARAFLASNGDLPTVYRALVDDPASWSSAGSKFRSPWDWTVAALRAADWGNLPNPQRGHELLLPQGQPSWRPGSPAGWGDTAADWASPGALFLRVELAQRIAARVGDRQDPRQLSKTVLADALTPATAAAVGQAEQSAVGLALLLASPEFMRR